jgi:hypothetical protein
VGVGAGRRRGFTIIQAPTGRGDNARPATSSKEADLMMQFKTGDRVRVRNTPRTQDDAGKTGTVVGIKQDIEEPIAVCQVRLDEAGMIDNVFLPDQLELVPD